MTLDVGSCNGKPFRLPLDLVTQTIAILAKRGVGKTYTAAVITEELLGAGQHTVIIDPLDVWWGLRSSASGKKAGLPVVVFGGEHGDVPLTADDGAAIAELVVRERISSILSTRHLSKGDQRRLVTAFAERIYELKGRGEHRQPLHLVIDEADAFCPQRIPHGQERMVGSIDDLVRRGRASGIGVTLITQRAAVINKDVLTQTEMLVALRTTSPQDRKAVEAWVEAHDVDDRHDEFMASLASLDVGTAWFWSPGWLNVFARVNVRRRRTFDSSATPDVDGTPVQAGKLASVDLDAVRAKLQSSIERAEASDPGKLRRRIAELEKKLVEASSQVELAPDTIDVLIGAEVAKMRRACEQTISSCRGFVDSAVEALAAAVVALSRPLPEHVAAAPQATPRTAGARPPVSRRAPAHDPQPANGAEVGRGGKHRILVALAQHGVLSDSKIGALTGLSIKGGTYGTYIGQLRSGGLITGQRTNRQITEAGIHALGSFDPLPTGAALRDWWREKIGGGGRRRIFDALCEVWPQAMDTDTLAVATDLAANGGTFATYLGALRTLGIIEKTADGHRVIKALFEE